MSRRGRCWAAFALLAAPLPPAPPFSFSFSTRGPAARRRSASTAPPIRAPPLATRDTAPRPAAASALGCRRCGKVWLQPVCLFCSPISFPEGFLQDHLAALSVSRGFTRPS